MWLLLMEWVYPRRLNVNIIIKWRFARVASANHASVLIIICWASHCHFEIFFNRENKDLIFATIRMQHGSAARSSSISLMRFHCNV